MTTLNLWHVTCRETTGLRSCAFRTLFFYLSLLLFEQYDPFTLRHYRLQVVNVCRLTASCIMKSI